MNREIKFRAKDRHGKFVYGDLVLMCSVPHIVTSPGVMVAIDPDTVGQFMNIYDAEGREVYEGDMVCDPRGMFTIRYDMPDIGRIMTLKQQDIKII